MSELGLPHNLELQARYAAFSKEEFHRRFVACLVARGFTLDSPDDSYYGVEFQSTPGAGKASTECHSEIMKQYYPQPPVP